MAHYILHSPLLPCHVQMVFGGGKCERLFTGSLGNKNDRGLFVALSFFGVLFLTKVMHRVSSEADDC